MVDWAARSCRCSARISSTVWRKRPRSSTYSSASLQRNQEPNKKNVNNDAYNPITPGFILWNPRKPLLIPGKTRYNLAQ